MKVARCPFLAGKSATRLARVVEKLSGKMGRAGRAPEKATKPKVGVTVVCCKIGTILEHWDTASENGRLATMPYKYT